MFSISAATFYQIPRVETVLQDLRSGIRNIRSAPGFSFILILMLALGIGANTAIFSVIHAVLLSSPPYPHGERLVEVWEAASGQNIPVNWINFQHWRQENRTFETMAGFETADLPLIGRGDAMLAHAAIVTSAFFRLTGWRPLMGRLIGENDDRPGAAAAVLITAEFWTRKLGRDPNVVGSALNLDGKSYEVVGILPPDLRFLTQAVDFYLPAGPRNGDVLDRGNHGSMAAVGLLKPGVTRAMARADLDAIMRRLALADPGPESEHHTFVAWLAAFGTDDIRQPLLMLMGAVGLVLIIACANVASLLLARSTTRVREIAIRSAIGGGRGRLARQILTENLVLAAMGGGLGLVLAEVCLRVLLVVGPRDIPRLWEASLNLQVLSFSAALTVITGLIAGLAPVARLGKLDLTLALKEGSPAASGGRRGHALRGGVVIAQIAVTLLLTFSCGLLLRSLALAQTSYPGFDPERLLAFEVQLPRSRYGSDDTVRRFYKRLIDAVRREPGVVSVGAVNCPPSSPCARGWYSISDMPRPSPANVPLTFLSSVDPSYFATMRIHLLAGRSFTDADRRGGPPVAVVNEKLARFWWPMNPNLAVGHPLKFGGPYMEGSTYEIVGVVASVSQTGLDSEPFAEVHVNFAQSASSAMVVMVRFIGDPARIIPSLRRDLAAIDPTVPVQSLRPFEQWIGATLERRRFSTSLFGIFAALAVALSSAGIYGMLSYWVGVRRKEIAIRFALGARRSRILLWIAGQAARVVGAGVTLGLFASWWASQWLSGMVFKISAQDPSILFAAAGAVVAIAAAAASIPIWRASRVDPIRTLHDA